MTRPMFTIAPIDLPSRAFYATLGLATVVAVAYAWSQALPAHDVAQLAMSVLSLHA